ncbi:MAG TPA: hypothetical protein VHZ76_09800, partial [Gammaproteobacteria bacterium]|nr:hypothetical protein [Gammaproteobacteria bacterium]
SKYILQKHTEKLDGNEKLTAGAVGEEAFKKKLTQDAAGNRLSPAAKDAAMKQELAAMKERQEWSGYAQQALSAQLEAHDKIASDPLTFKKEEEATAADVHNRLDENYLRSEQDRRNAIEALDKEHTDAERRITVMEKEIQAEKVAITNKDPRMRTADDVKRLGELDGMTKNINGIKEKQSELSKQLTGKGVQPSADPNQPNPPSLKEQDTKNMAAIKRKEPKPEPVKASEEERRPGRSISAGGP